MALNKTQTAAKTKKAKPNKDIAPVGATDPKKARRNTGRPRRTIRRSLRAQMLTSDEEPKAVVATVTEDLLAEEEHPAIQQLVEVGKQKNFVTYDDILRFFPEAERD